MGKLLSKENITRRKREEENTIFDKRSYFEQDYGRIIFSPSFIRLQDKAKVSTLETNDFVRTRLTHSLEVLTIARSIGIDLKDFLKEKNSDTDNNEIYEYILKIFKFVIFLVNFFPPQKVAKSARIELVLNHTKIVLHVR
ncbi:hypothetical protein [uncultured Brachyspira sp.]|uniref:hypothetical protein n=1 Tax=uncultured Brachyspira sp. TaxID=221953 RepID=UPI00261D65B5|nr:hypothetical protein [uncultured Brachyspira sp.]